MENGWFFGVLAVIVLALLAMVAFVQTPDAVVEEEWYNPVLDRTEYPLVTEFSATEFEHAILGFTCDNPNWEYENTMEFNTFPDEFGYYGFPGVTIMDGQEKIVTYSQNVECRIILEYDDLGRPLRGTFAFRLRFDPNNGFIYEQVCNEEYLADICPRDDDGNVIYIDYNPVDNPNYETYLALK